MTVIDLGYADPDPAADPGRLFDRRSLRRLVLGAILLLCLSTLTNSALPQTRGLRTVWSLPGVGGTYLTIVGDNLITLGRDDSRRVSSYALADGRLRWTHEMSGQVPYLDASRDAKVLLVPAGEVVRAGTDGDQTYFSATVALDPATGAELWRSDGVSQGWVTAEQALLWRFDAAGDEVVQVIAVRLSDGARLWDRPVEGNTQALPLHARPALAQQVALVTGNAVTILRLTDGAELGSGTIDATTGDPEAGNLNLMYADQDALYVLESAQTTLSATAYSATTLRQLWRFELTDGGGGIYPCGPVLCVGRPTGLAGYDLRTGRLVWQAPGMNEGSVTDNGVLIASKPSGYAIAMDPATGRTIADLGSGDLLWGGDLLVMMTPVFNRTGYSSITVYDPVTGEGFPLGVIAAGYDWNCPVVDRYLVCGDPQGTMTVTALG